MLLLCKSLVHHVRFVDVDAVLSIIPKMLNTMVVNTMKGDLHESVRALQVRTRSCNCLVRELWGGTGFPQYRGVLKGRERRITDPYTYIEAYGPSV